MILEKIELNHFGRFGVRVFDFRPGMNLVAGANEAGKSTLMAAIPAVLFGLRDKERFIPWGRQGGCGAALTFASGAGRVRIERELLTDRVTVAEFEAAGPRRDFEGKAAPLGRSSERSEYLEILQRHFGIVDEDLFRSSLFFGQGSLEVGSDRMAGRIKGLLSGFAEVDYDRVLQSLQDDYFAVTRSNPWGKDKTRNRELDDVRARIEELQEKWRAAQGAMREHEMLQARITRLQQEIEADRDEYHKGERYIAWVRKKWQLEEKQEILRKDFSRVNRQSEKVAELQERRGKIEKDLAQTGLPHAIPEQLPVLLVEADEIRQELIELQKGSTSLRREMLAQANPAWKPWAGLTLVLVAAIVLLNWWRPGHLLAAGFVGCLPLVVAWGIYLRRLLRATSERNRLKGQVQVIDDRREEAQARLAGLDDRFQALGLSPSAVDLVRMQKNIGRHQELMTQLREIESALRVLENGEDLGGEKDHLARELAVIEERKERERPLQPNLLPPEAIPEAEEKLAALGESLRAREKELVELTRRAAAMQGEIGDLQQIEEEGERLQEREAILARRKEALAIAYDLLSGAVDDFRRTYLDHFAGEIGTYLQATTGGRYDGVRLDEDFSLWLQGREGEWQMVEQFSRGTVDGVYMAVRLALVRHLSRGVPLPLFLDDPLVNLDRLRLAASLKTLERLAGEHQVLLFTHSDSLARKAVHDRWHVVSLDEAKIPAPVRARPAAAETGQMSFI